MNGVAILIYDYSLLGGVQKVTLNLTNLLLQNGISVKCLISLQSTNDIQYEYPIDIEIIHNDYPTAQQLENIVAKYEISHVIAQVENLKLFYPVIRNLSALGCKVFPVLHNTPYYWIKKYYDWQQYITSPRFLVQYLKMALYWKPLHMKLFRSIVSRYGMICVGRQAKKELCHILKLPEDTPQIRYICNPIDISPLEGEGEKENIMVYAGRLSFEKRPMLMLKLWKNLCAIHPDWRFIILGDGPDRKKMERYISRHHMERIELPGTVRNVTEYLKRSKISVLLSKYEGLSTSMLEAAYNNNALIVARSDGGAVDIVADQLNGFIINVNDFASLVSRASELMEANGQKAVSMGNRNNAVLKEFNKTSIFAQWERLLQ